MSAKELNPFRNPWRILAIAIITVGTPFALFIGVKFGDNPELLQQRESGVVTWSPIHDPQEQHNWVCKQLESYRPTPEMQSRYEHDCK